MIKFIKQLLCLHKHRETKKVFGTKSIFECEKCKYTRTFSLSDAYCGDWINIVNNNKDK